MNALCNCTGAAGSPAALPRCALHNCTYRHNTVDMAEGHTCILDCTQEVTMTIAGVCRQLASDSVRLSSSE